MYDTELKSLSDQVKELAETVKTASETKVTKTASSKKLNSEYILDFLKFFVK